MKKTLFTLTALTGLVFTSCSSDDENPTDPIIAIENPATFVFTRNGESTVDFNGQTTRILMGEEILDAIKDEENTSEVLNAMLAHVEGAEDFENADLNASDKSILSKIADSEDYFDANPTDQALIRADFTGFIDSQVSEVFPNFGVVAEAGVAGQIADGTSTRYINAQGLEYNQAFNKSLIGALMVDQALNNYLSPAVLKESLIQIWSINGMKLMAILMV